MSRVWHLFLPAALLFAGCGSRPDPVRNEPKTAAARVEAGGEIVLPEDSLTLDQIRTEPVSIREEPWDEFETPGKVELDPNRVSHVLMPAPGRVQQVLVKLGDSVSEGQPLLIIESPEAMSAAAAYSQAQAEVRRARSGLAKAGRDLGRVRDLFEHRAAAQRDVWAAENELVQTQAAVEQAEAEEEQARHRLDVLGISPGKDPRNLPVRAPISGKVLEIAVAPGEYRSDTAANLMLVVDLSRVWITSNVSENQIRLIQIGEVVEVELSAYPGEVIRGTVKRIAETLDPETRAVKVQIEVDNRDGRLRPGMFGRIRHSHGIKRVPAVPAAAVVHGEGGDYVYVETGPRRYRKRSVQAGQLRNGWAPVIDGLKPGERVVVDGAILLRGK